MQKMADSSVYDTPDIKHDDLEINSVYDKPNISNSDNYYNTLNQPHQSKNFEDPDSLNSVKPTSHIKSLIKNRKFIGISLGLMLSILIIITLIIVVVYFTGELKNLFTIKNIIFYTNFILYLSTMFVQ
jgi:hypothetical protein